MKYCSKHHANPDDALFCNECGEKLVKATLNTTKCQVCNAENPQDAEYCHACGHSFAKRPNPPKLSTSKSKPVNSNISSGKKIGIIDLVIGAIIIIVVCLCLGRILGVLSDLIKLLGLILN